MCEPKSSCSRWLRLVDSRGLFKILACSRELSECATLANLGIQTALDPMRLATSLEKM
jgi:hypothetical protein